jgi:hypothetical protein
VAAPKVLPRNYRSRLFPEKPAKRELLVHDNKGRKYKIMIRENLVYPDNFSVILMHILPLTNNYFCLRRYNCVETHNNLLEEEKLHGYHIHIATERYQLAGRKAEGYAVKTDRYTNSREAFACMIEDCNFLRPENERKPLLEYSDE